MTTVERKPPLTRAAFTYFASLPTRWSDNDMYGHVNNVVYYSYFDTAIAGLLLEEGGLDPWNAEVIGIVVENGCRFHSSVGLSGQGHGRCRHRASRHLVGSLHHRHLSQRRGHGLGGRPLRPRLRRPRDAAAGRHSAAHSRRARKSSDALSPVESRLSLPLATTPARPLSDSQGIDR